ncbi:MAG: lysophospholipid acyltransferase family protein [Candidatus Omnitrophota bacterium]|nr:MAG: lysophospholipid acyltransferase family protein [Candidatus Omnitrophota bacterium]
MLALILPRRISYFVARIIAVGQYCFSKKDRRAVLYNLSPIIADKARLKKCARGVFINFSYYLVDFFRFSKLHKSFMDKYVEVIGLHHLTQSLAKGKGIIALTAHLGNYELGAAAISLLGYPMCAVALPHRDKRVNAFFDGQRHRVGVEVIPTGVAVKRCFARLREGKVIAFVGDRDFSGGEAKFKMFSQYAHLPKGPAFFATRTDAIIVPSFFVRKDKFFYQLIFDEPFVYKKEEFRSEEDFIQTYTKVLEKYIQRYPEQWYMFEKCWIKE